MPVFPPRDRYIEGFEEGVKESYAIGLEEGKAQFAFVDHIESISFGNVSADDETALRHYPNMTFLRAKKLDYLFFKNYAVETVGDVYAPQATSIQGAFRTCSVSEVGVINVPNATNLAYLFYDSGSPTKIGGIYAPKAAAWDSVFYGCGRLVSIGGKLDFSNAISHPSSTFYLCKLLEQVEFVAGSIHLGVDLKTCPKLNDVSIQSIVDGFADMTGQETVTLTLHADVKAKLTETQIATLTGKNVTIA